MKKRVILDTSILLLLYDGVDVFGDIRSVLEANPECIVPRHVVNELEKLISSKSIHKRKAAQLALSIVEKQCRIVDVESVDKTDDAIIKLVLSDRDSIVATADNELRRRLRELGKPNIYYRRSRRSLMLES